jgi:predicted negative regulator of RcsB-dependent stress response
LHATSCARSESQGQAALEQARSAHSAADRALDEGEPARAKQELSQALSRLGESKGEQAVWMRQDLLARLAQLELDAGNASAALEVAGRALELGQEPSVPLATLHVLRGRAFEAQGDKKSAALAYHQALLINQSLMDQALGTEPSQMPENSQPPRTSP